MKTGEKVRRGRGCLAAAIVGAGVALVCVVIVGVHFWRAVDDPASTEYRLWLVMRGEKSTEQFATEIIIDHLARRAGLPPEDAAALRRELGPISEELPRLSEGEKHKLAVLIREAIGDGELTDEEREGIREYSYRSARDGNAKP